MQVKPSTRQKILESAIQLFAMKGYTETTIRELAAAVGIKEASLYNHFPSKSAILDYILEEYAQIASPNFIQERLVTLKDNPSAEGILSCMRLIFPEGKEEYYFKELCVIIQEQHRNPVVRKFMSEEIILSTEQVVRVIIDKLKECGHLRPDTDGDFWIKAHSSLLYAFASRALLGIGDSSSNFSGMGMVEMLQQLFDLMLKTCGVQDVTTQAQAKGTP
jgi:AcrR family transcriptional regulator